MNFWLVAYSTQRTILPLIFGEVEKELAWDGKKMLKSIREELTAYARGEKTFRELFWED